MRWIGLAVFFTIVISTNNSIKQCEEELANLLSDFDSYLEEYEELVRGKIRSDIQHQLEELRDLVDPKKDFDHERKMKWEAMAPRRGRATFGKDQLSKEEFDAKLIEMLKLRFSGLSQTEMIEEFSRKVRQASFYFPHSFENLQNKFSEIEPEYSTDKYLAGMFNLIGFLNSELEPLSLYSFSERNE